MTGVYASVTWRHDKVVLEIRSIIDLINQLYIYINHPKLISKLNHPVFKTKKIENGFGILDKIYLTDKPN